MGCTCTTQVTPISTASTQIKTTNKTRVSISNNHYAFENTSITSIKHSVDQSAAQPIKDNVIIPTQDDTILLSMMDDNNNVPPRSHKYRFENNDGNDNDEDDEPSALFHLAVDESLQGILRSSGSCAVSVVSSLSDNFKPRKKKSITFSIEDDVVFDDSNTNEKEVDLPQECAMYDFDCDGAFVFRWLDGNGPKWIDCAKAPALSLSKKHIGITAATRTSSKLRFVSSYSSRFDVQVLCNEEDLFWNGVFCEE
eukprot:PhM_4_TR7984/c0_g1_i1/m.13036